MNSVLWEVLRAPLSRKAYTYKEYILDEIKDKIADFYNLLNKLVWANSMVSISDTVKKKSTGAGVVAQQ